MTRTAGARALSIIGALVALAPIACVRETSRVIVVVHPSGVPATSSLLLTIALDGAPASAPQAFAGTEDALDLELPDGTSGDVALALAALDCHECAAARGTARVAVAGNGRYDVDLPLQSLDAADCPRGHLLEERYGGSAVLLRVGPDAGRIALFGPSADIEIYDPDTRMSKPSSARLIAARGPAAVTLDDGRVILIGGWDGQVRHTEVEIYDPRSDTITERASIPIVASGGIAVLIDGGRVLHLGGNTASGPSRDAWLYDVAADRWSSLPSMMEARFSEVAVRLPDDRVLVVGGGTTGAIEVLDPDAPSPAWTSPASLPGPYWFVSGVGLGDGRVLIAGGQASLDNGRTLLTSFVIDPDALTPVIPVGDLHDPHRGAPMALLADGRAAIVAGNNMPIVSSVEIFDPATGLFRTSTPLAWPRVGHQATALPDGSVVVTGGLGGPGQSDIGKAPAQLQTERLFPTPCP